MIKEEINKNEKNNLKRFCIELLKYGLIIAINIGIFLYTVYTGYHQYDENLVTIRLIIAYITQSIYIFCTFKLIIISCKYYPNDAKE